MEFFRQILVQLIKKNLWLAVSLMATLLIGTLGYTILSKGQYYPLRLSLHDGDHHYHDWIW